MVRRTISSDERREHERAAGVEALSRIENSLEFTA
jgi:hypothetical protein